MTDFLDLSRALNRAGEFRDHSKIPFFDKMAVYLQSIQTRAIQGGGILPVIQAASKSLKDCKNAWK